VSLTFRVFNAEPEKADQFDTDAAAADRTVAGVIGAAADMKAAAANGANLQPQLVVAERRGSLARGELAVKRSS